MTQFKWSRAGGCDAVKTNKQGKLGGAENEKEDKHKCEKTRCQVMAVAFATYVTHVAFDGMGGRNSVISVNSVPIATHFRNL